MVVKADIVLVATWKRDMIYFVKTELLKLFRDTDSLSFGSVPGAPLLLVATTLSVDRNSYGGKDT